MQEFFLALALILVIEGGLYAAFPAAMKRMIFLVLQQPVESLRSAGLTTAMVGVGLVWAVSKFTE